MFGTLARQGYLVPIPQPWHDGIVKRKAEYVEGPEASANFERTMRGLFQIPRTETPERPKRGKRRKKASGKATTH
jgi:hypothetical protein